MSKAFNKKAKNLSFSLGVLTIVVSAPLTFAASCGYEQKPTEKPPIELKNINYEEFASLKFNDEDWERKGWFFENAGYTRENIKFIGTRAFQKAFITKLELPNATFISDESFIENFQLTTIILPKVAEVGVYAFLDSPLTYVYIPKAKEIGSGSFYSTINEVSTKITVPKSFNTPRSLYLLFSKSTNEGVDTSKYDKITFEWIDESGNVLPNEKTNLTPYNSYN